MSEEIENDEVETDAPEIEIIEEGAEDDAVDQVEEAPVEEAAEPAEEAPVEQAAAEESAEGESGSELAEYSESVQRRIRKLTAKYREEERQREAALEYAEAVKKKNEELQLQLQEKETSYVGEMGTRLERDLDSAKAFLKVALDEGDSDQVFEAQRRISELTLQQAEHAQARQRVERFEQPQAPEFETPQAPAQEAKKEPDPRAQEWAEKNSWFGQDESMTYAAFGIHRKLVEEEGFDPTSDEYYTEIDRRIRTDFPNKFEEITPESSRPRVASAESTASKTSKKGRRTVKLSPSQVAIAKKLGVPLEEYAKYVKE
jgi:hypothetical protein